MSANIEQIKTMLERTGKTDLLQKQKVDLDKERLQLEATVNIEKTDKSLEEAAEEWCKINNKGIALCADKKSHYLAEGVDAFKAGAKWMEKEINKELIKAAEKVHEIRDIDYDIHVDTSAIGSFETTSYYENGKLVGQEQSKKEE